MATDPSAKQSDDTRDLALRAIGTPFAAMSAFVKFWADWAKSSIDYSRGLSEEVARIRRVRDGGKGTTARVAGLTREYLRTVVDLPAATAQHFLEEVERRDKPQGEQPKGARERAARTET
jgi:hypothetical protein